MVMPNINLSQISIIIILSMFISLTYLFGANEQKQVAIYSRRWKKMHNVNDFLWLKDNALRIGASQQHVIDIFGKPLNDLKPKDEIESWLYTKCDFSKNQTRAWYIIFRNKKVSKIHGKPCE